MLSTVLMFSMFNSNVIHASNKSSKYTEKEVELLKESKRIDELQINQVLTNLDNQLYTNRSSNTLNVKEELRAYRSSSQLVWLAWLDSEIDIEKGSFPNGVVSPADLANSSNTYLVERIR